MAQSTSNNRALWLGLGAIVLLLSLLTYMLVIRPVMSETADLNEQALARENANDILEISIQSLEAESKEVPAYEATIAEVRQDLPAREDLAQFDRYLDGLMREVGTTIWARDFEPTYLVTPPVVVEVVPVAPAPEATESAESNPTPTPSPSPSASPEPVVPTATTIGEGLVVEGLYATPVDIGLYMSQDQTLLFLSLLQLGDHRYFSVTDLVMERVDPTLRSGQMPPVLPGDVRVEIRGNVYTYLEPDVDPNETTLPDGAPYPRDDFSQDPTPDFYEAWFPSQPLLDAALATLAAQAPAA